MKQLEDRIKDRLEGYESSLPEGDLAEFKTLLEKSAASSPKRSTAYIAWLVPAVAAAALALFFVLRPDPQKDLIQIIDSTPLVAADSADSKAAESVAVESRTGESVGVKHGLGASGSDEAEVAASKDDDSVPVRFGSNESSADGPEAAKSEPAGSELTNGNAREIGNTASNTAGYTAFAPYGSNINKPISMKVAQATTGVLGGALAMAVATVIPQILSNSDSSNNGLFTDDGPGNMDPGYTAPPIDKRTYDDTHHMPLQTGISIRIPLSERWALTSGLDYSWYISDLGYTLSGIHKQSVHYLGIPLKANYTIARNRWMDVYVGAGGAAEFCLAAYNNGNKITRDGAIFSFIGAGGIQFNINRHLGLFIDPTLSWAIPSEKRVLETYRTDNPFMVTVSAGLRFNVPALR